MKKIAAFFAVLSLAGCAQHILDAEVVSMTTRDPPKGAVKRGEEIKEEWCRGDTPAKEEPDRVYGLMDQVILKAQKKHKASYIADASFYTKGSCITMTGKVVK